MVAACYNGEFVFFIQFYLIWITIVGGENAGARSTGKIFSRLACCGNRRRRGDEQQQNTESLESASSQVGVVFCVGRFGKKCWSWKKVFWGFWLKKWEVPNVFAFWTDAPEPTVRSDYASGWKLDAAVASGDLIRIARRFGGYYQQSCVAHTVFCSSNTKRTRHNYRQRSKKGWESIINANLVPTRTSNRISEKGRKVSNCIFLRASVIRGN